VTLDYYKASQSTASIKWIMDTPLLDFPSWVSQYTPHFDVKPEDDINYMPEASIIMHSTLSRVALDVMRNRVHR
jgi:hypothetical protein